MRLVIDHHTAYRFTEPQARVVQLLRMTPSDHDTQSVVDWRIDIDCDARLKTGRDGFGNITRMLYVDGPVEAIDITVHGEVITEDSAGILRGTVEPLPPLLFARTTTLTVPGTGLPAFAREAAGDGDRLDALHRLNRAIHARFRRVAGRPDMTRTAADTFDAGAGVARDIAHLFIAAARSLDMPARFVSGHCLSANPGQPLQTAHSWAEAHVEGLGWVAFDPCWGRCPDKSYVRVAVGLDARYATPISGARRGGGEEDLDVDVRVDVAQPED
jgi:transglutaminase-like putative cysteine protease